MWSWPYHSPGQVVGEGPGRGGAARTSCRGAPVPWRRSGAAPAPGLRPAALRRGVTPALAEPRVHGLKTGPLERTRSRAQARFCGGDSVSRCSEIWHPKVHFTLHPEQDIDAPLDSLQVSQRAPARDLAKIPPAWLSRPARGSLFTGPPSTAKVRAQRHLHRARHRKFCAPPRRGAAPRAIVRCTGRP